jgi:hypothetical protein
VIVVSATVGREPIYWAAELMMLQVKEWSLGMESDLCDEFLLPDLYHPLVFFVRRRNGSSISIILAKDKKF